MGMSSTTRLQNCQPGQDVQFLCCSLHSAKEEETESASVLLYNAPLNTFPIAALHGPCAAGSETGALCFSADLISSNNKMHPLWNHSMSNKAWWKPHIRPLWLALTYDLLWLQTLQGVTKLFIADGEGALSITWNHFNKILASGWTNEAVHLRGSGFLNYFPPNINRMQIFFFKGKWAGYDNSLNSQTYPTFCLFFLLFKNVSWCKHSLMIHVFELNINPSVVSEFHWR